MAGAFAGHQNLRSALAYGDHTTDSHDRRCTALTGTPDIGDNQ
ncbi:hypothetical protein [Streptomyces sp. NPDC058108]